MECDFETSPANSHARLLFQRARMPWFYLRTLLHAVVVRDCFFFQIDTIVWCSISLTALGGWSIQDGKQRSIVECGARGQQVILSSHSLSIAKLRQRICKQFDLPFEDHDPVVLQMYADQWDAFSSWRDENQRLDAMTDLQSTVKKLRDAMTTIDRI